MKSRIKANITEEDDYNVNYFTDEIVIVDDKEQLLMIMTERRQLIWKRQTRWTRIFPPVKNNIEEGSEGSGRGKRGGRGGRDGGGGRGRDHGELVVDAAIGTAGLLEEGR